MFIFVNLGSGGPSLLMLVFFLASQFILDGSLLGFISSLFTLVSPYFVLLVCKLPAFVGYWLRCVPQLPVRPEVCRHVSWPDNRCAPAVLQSFWTDLMAEVWDTLIPSSASPSPRPSSSRAPPQERPNDSAWGEFTSLVVPMISTYLLVTFLKRLARQQGGWGNLFGVGAGGGGQQGGGPDGRRGRATFEQVAAALQKLPTELHLTRDDMEQAPVGELKAALSRSGLDCSGCLEKCELIDMAASLGGSSFSSCSICCDDYESQQAVRVLPCHHRFHIECIDKWFLSSTDFSRPPACPLCNAELKL